LYVSSTKSNLTTSSIFLHGGCVMSCRSFQFTCRCSLIIFVGVTWLRGTCYVVSSRVCCSALRACGRPPSAPPFPFACGFLDCMGRMCATPDSGRPVHGHVHVQLRKRNQNPDSLSFGMIVCGFHELSTPASILGIVFVVGVRTAWSAKFVA